MAKTLREKIEVMEAFERGEEIQSRPLCNPRLKWEDAKNPKWSWSSLDYRVKPKPREWFIADYATQPYSNCAYRSREECETKNPNAFRIIRVVEVGGKSADVNIE